MTAIVARPPLHPLPMSSSQRQPRRLSARLHEKDHSYDEQNANAAQNAPAAETTKENSRKRKPTYEEEDDGFMFSRVKKKKQKEASKPATIPEETTTSKPRPTTASRNDAQSTQRTVAPRPVATEPTEPTKKRQKKKMSFSTPIPAEKQPVRRSKRLSDENEPGSPRQKSRRKADEAAQSAPEPVPERVASPLKVAKKRAEEPKQTEPQPLQEAEAEVSESHSATKIALPFADTPVIRRNKEMRENKGKKGERRSSLSLRGRRASSLIDSGNSNALPHDEVEVTDFYKHIEADGLPEPRRMRQLLTWCATRSLDQKPMGANFEESSAISAARVIQDELLKDLGNKSELSDWFSREEISSAPKELPERPNPKNIQNTQKIAELEEQIKRLRTERDALESLLRPPSIPLMPKSRQIDTTLLSPEEAAIFQQLRPDTSSVLETRIDALYEQLEPAVDIFADNVHKVAQYRDAADSIASRVLSIAAEKLADRENDGRRRAQSERARSPRRDLGSVLRGLSRADR